MKARHILLIIAAIVFALAAFGVATPVALVPAGLCIWAIAELA